MIEVAAVLSCTAALFAQVGAKPQLLGSSFDAFVEGLVANTAATAALPVVTAEIGDVWIFGAQSDPWKAKMMRLFTRARTGCIEAGDCDSSDPAIANFTRLLLKGTEHTFGLHSLLDKTMYSNADLHKTLAAGSPLWKSVPAASGIMDRAT